MPETKKPMHPLNLPPTGNPGNGDSIKPKVFGKGGMGFGEGREKLFFRKVSPPFPNISNLLYLPGNKKAFSSSGLQPLNSRCSGKRSITGERASFV